MAYVLGIIFTDGCLTLDKNTRSTTVNKRLSIAQKEPEILMKVLDLMKCNAKLYFKKRLKYGSIVSGEIYRFDVSNERVYDDLVNLGLHPRKSLDIEFPKIPPEYLRHFIRGCWDGDGSVYYEKRKGHYLMASFVSGSLKFIEGVLVELERAGLPRRTIHTREGKVPSYYFRYTGPQCVMLYHYLYDNVPPTQYLERKYNLFSKVCGMQQNGLF